MGGRWLREKHHDRGVDEALPNNQRSFWEARGGHACERRPGDSACGDETTTGGRGLGPDVCSRCAQRVCPYPTAGSPRARDDGGAPTPQPRLDHQGTPSRQRRGSPPPPPLPSLGLEREKEEREREREMEKRGERERELEMKREKERVQGRERTEQKEHEQTNTAMCPCYVHKTGGELSVSLFPSFLGTEPGHLLLGDVPEHGPPLRKHF